MLELITFIFGVICGVVSVMVGLAVFLTRRTKW